MRNKRYRINLIRLRAMRGALALLGTKIDRLTQGVESLENHVDIVRDDMAEFQMNLDRSIGSLAKTRK